MIGPACNLTLRIITILSIVKAGPGLAPPVRRRILGRKSTPLFHSFVEIVMPTIQLNVPPARRVSDTLLVVVAVLISLSIAGQCAKYLYGHTILKGFVPMFYVDFESSAPTWYSSAALGLAGLLLAVIAMAKFQAADKYRWHWATLSCLFALLSLDEIAMIHELPVDPLRERFAPGGVLYYPWVIPGALFVALIGCLYLRFYLTLPGRTQRLLLLSGAMFVSGAIGVEMLSGVQADQFGENNLDYALIVSLEEMLEMLGVVIFIRCLLDYIERHLGGLRIQFAAGY